MGTNVAGTFLGESKTFKVNSKTWFPSSVKQWQGRLEGELNLPKVSLWLRKPNFLRMQVQGLVVSRVLVPALFWVCHWPCATEQIISTSCWVFICATGLFGFVLYRESHSLKKAIHPGKEQRFKVQRGTQNHYWLKVLPKWQPGVELIFKSLTFFFFHISTAPPTKVFNSEGTGTHREYASLEIYRQVKLCDFKIQTQGRKVDMCCWSQLKDWTRSETNQGQTLKWQKIIF